MAFYPMKLIPACKDYIWGGTRLAQYHKGAGLDRVSEAWELSANPNGFCTVANGQYIGQTFDEVVRIPGMVESEYSEFPLLFKLIDAADRLSVQVHPGFVRDSYRPKTEMWYVLDAQPDATIVYGFRKDVTQDELRGLLQENKLEDVLNVVPARKGDCFFIPAGLVHAIGRGLLIAEVQQNSNTTFRMYDYGRLGTDGQPRALHIEEALDAVTLTHTEYQPYSTQIVHRESGITLEDLISCEFFTAQKIVVSAASVCPSNDRFAGLFVLSGGGRVEGNGLGINVDAFDTIFLPAGLEEYTLTGEFEALRFFV